MKQTLKKLIHEALTLFLTRLYQSTQTQMDSIFIIFSYWASRTRNANNSQTIPWNVFKNADSDSVDLRQSWDFAFLTTPQVIPMLRQQIPQTSISLVQVLLPKGQPLLPPRYLFFLSPSLFFPSFHKCVWRIDRFKNSQLCQLENLGQVT